MSTSVISNNYKDHCNVTIDRYLQPLRDMLMIETKPCGDIPMRENFNLTHATFRIILDAQN